MYIKSNKTRENENKFNYKSKSEECMLRTHPGIKTLMHYES